MSVVQRISTRKAVVATAAAALVLALVMFIARGDSSKAEAPTPATSVIILSGDGMGIQQRTAIQYALYGLNERQPMDALPYTGFLDTIPAGPIAVTDSAAGATAWAIGQKTINGYTGLPPSKERVPTLLDIAKAQGKTTALINDHDVTNATLASFGGPVIERDWKSVIADKEIYNNKVDILMGGNEAYWYPPGNDGMIPNTNKDGEDDSEGTKGNLVEKAISQGYQYAYDKETVAGLTGPRVLALVQDSAKRRWIETKGYKLGKDPHYVPVVDMVNKALDIADNNPNGFFMAMESDDLDSAGHEHDVRNVIESGKTVNQIVAAVQEYRKTNPNVLLIVTADHETGGMTIEPMGETNTNSDGDDPIPYWSKKPLNNAGPKGEVPIRSGPVTIKGTNRKFKVDWTTGEHTGGMVPVTAVGPNADELVGVHHNTWVFDVAKRALLGQE
ncbi:MAG: alkaline phosphatase [Solirubrobacterales bacterium]|nr:alkaline phosphatase [Solirubrobacterales bacterium]HMT04182.1 alkaline phosphatase [Solirubrobacterales bacterium]